MGGLFAGTPFERPVTCETCGAEMARCACPRDASGKVLLPKDQPARVRRETGGRRGKTVTIITGLDPIATDLAALLKRLRTALGTGGTVTGAAIELQGDHRDRVVAMLRELGYPAKAAGG